MQGGTKCRVVKLTTLLTKYIQKRRTYTRSIVESVRGINLCLIHSYFFAIRHLVPLCIELLVLIHRKKSKQKSSRNGFEVRTVK